jgi:hypothetical protein
VRPSAAETGLLEGESWKTCKKPHVIRKVHLSDKKERSESGYMKKEEDRGTRESVSKKRGL